MLQNFRTMLLAFPQFSAYYACIMLFKNVLCFYFVYFFCVQRSSSYVTGFWENDPNRTLEVSR